MKIKNFKEEAIIAITNHLPDEDEGKLIEGSWKINISRSNEYGTHTSKNKITIEWDEIYGVEHPCKGCPGFDHL